MPARIEESASGDVEAQVHWRFEKETGRRPELFSNLEVVLPLSWSRRRLHDPDALSP